MSRFCSRCGSPCAENALFCEKCGAKLEPAVAPGVPAEESAEAENTPVSAPAPGTPDTPAPPAKAGISPEKPKLTKKALLGICCAAVGVCVITAAILLTVSAARTVRLDRYITVTQKGVEGFGTVSWELDGDALKEKLLENAGVDYENSFSGMFSVYGALSELMNDVDVILPENNGCLKNGDSVCVRVTYGGPAKSKYFRCRIRGGEITYQVKDLPAAEAYDLLSEERVSVTFSDTYPNGWGVASVKSALSWSDPLYGCFNYRLDKERGLKNGDVVTLTADFGDGLERARQYAARAGYVFDENASRQFTVRGLTDYASAAQITESVVEKAKSLALADLAEDAEKTDAQIIGVLFKDAIEKDYERDYSAFMRWDPDCYNRLCVCVRYEVAPAAPETQQAGAEAAEGQPGEETSSAAPEAEPARGYTCIYFFSDLVIGEDGSVAPEAGWNVDAGRMNYVSRYDEDLSFEALAEKHIDCAEDTWRVTYY